MRSRLGLFTHLVSGAGCLFWLYSLDLIEINIYSVLIALVCCVLPDVDTTQSIIGKIIYPVARFIEHSYGHRTVTHSLFFVAFFGAFVWAVANDFFYLSVACVVAHICIDMFIGDGVQLFFPAPYRFGFAQFRTGSNAEMFLSACVFVISVLPIPMPTLPHDIASITEPKAKPTATQTIKHTIKIHAKTFDEIYVQVGDFISKGQPIALKTRAHIDGVITHEAIDQDGDEMIFTFTVEEW